MHLIFVGQGTHENYLTLNISQLTVYWFAMYVCCIRVNCEFTLLMKNTYTVYNILINVACTSIPTYYELQV